MLKRTGGVALLGLVWAPAAWAQAQPAAPPAPAAAPATEAFPAEAPAEQALPPAPVAPAPVQEPVAPAPAAVAAPIATTSAPEPARDTGDDMRPSHWKRSGFFASLQLGGGYFHASSGAADDTRWFNGGAVSGQLAIGGRVGRARQVVLAGAYLRDQVVGLTSKDQRIDGDEPHLDDVTFALWALGFLVDVKAQDEPGLHFQGLVGAGALSVSRNAGSTENPSGFMASLGVGYDFVSSEHFALGALLRGTYAPFSVDEFSGTTVNALAPALLLTASTR
jgi:hypothetical protein